MLSRNRRRLRRITIALLLLGLAAWIVPSYLSAERYRRRLQSGLERALHRTVRFTSLSFRLLPRPGFAIENVEVDEDAEFGSEPFARVDHIDCDLRWRSLWRSRMDFTHLSLERPNFNIVLNSRGKWNVEKLLLQSGVTAPPGSVASKPALIGERLDLDVDNARVNFQVGPDKKPFALTDVRARLQVSPTERRVQFQIIASPVRSDLTIPSPGPVELRGTWTPGVDLQGPFEASLRTRGALLYDWIPVVTGKNPQIYGVIDSDVQLVGSLPNLTVDGQANLTQFQRWEQLPPADPMPWRVHFRGRLVRARDRLQVETLDAFFADSHLHITGSVDKAESDPLLDCVVSLERSRLEDVLAVIHRFWPISNSWNVKGRIEAMLAIRGPWKQRRYGGFVGAQQVSLETASGTFPLSEVAMRIGNQGAVLAPLQITLAPRFALSVQGAVDRTKVGLQYEMQLAAKGLPLYDVVSFGRGLGIHVLQAIGASGTVTANIHLAGSAWPMARPALTARADMWAARLLIPGLTEPLNIPRATLQINREQVVVDPVVAVMGTSIFNARLVHQGARANSWKFNLRADSLDMEQCATWFDALGHRQPLALLARLPGLSSFAAQREAATHILGGLNAEGRFSTPALNYHGVTLKDFKGAFNVAGRTIRMTSATFRAGGGRGEAEGNADLTASPPLLSAKASLTDAAVQSLTVRLPGSVHGLRGSVSGIGNFQTRGAARKELSGNLTGQMQLRVKDISFADFDPLGALVEHAHWGTLEPAHSPEAVLPATLNIEVRDRSFILKSADIDLSGATLHLRGTYDWAGAMDLSVSADLRRLRRRWLSRDYDASSPNGLAAVRLGGPIDHLVVNPQEGVAAVVRSRGGGVR